MQIVTESEIYRLRDLVAKGLLIGLEYFEVN